MLFQLTDLTKIYGDRCVLDIPELSLKKGDICALLGPNGSGKTTLFEILSLLIPPSSGRIKYKGMNIALSGRHLTALRREIVMVQQNPVLFSTTVRKNLEFCLKIRGITSKARGKIIDGSLDLVRMREFSNAAAQRLSGGETQRVAIARALVCSPKVIFFDEPTANVDVENQDVIERTIGDINDQKKISVMFTTHNVVQAKKLSNRVISLFAGKMIPSTYENIYSGKIVENEEGNKYCEINEDISLPVNTEKTGNVRLSINPLHIRLLRGPDIRFKKDILKGRIIQLTEELGRVRATIDAGIQVHAFLPRYQVQEKSIYIGDDIGIQFPDEAVLIF
ncbi:MAG: ATP-binding cassette domain-containing protein [Desulfobacteraceae bacterium]|nr:ATP-binding cassette domain-containing protein [Desulfobacteraceae bacterium]